MRLVIAFGWVSLAAVGCTQDFGQYVPAGDAGGAADASTTDAAKDGAADSSCTPLGSCLNTAQSCGNTCKDQRETCSDQCGTNQGCKQSCTNTEKVCRSGCATACVTCTTNAGCAAPTQYTSAANK